MKIIDIIMIILLIILGIMVYYLFGIFFFKDDSKPIPSIPDIIIKNNNIKDETKGKSVINLDSCDFRKYDMDCKVVKFLEENLAWSNKAEGVNFCSYEYLGEKENNIYLVSSCQEFYISDSQMVCPDKDILEKCFVSKDKSECSECEIKDIDKRIVEGSGVSIPVRLTTNGNTFSLWTPRDGSLYQKDLKAEFPKDIYNLLSETKKNLKAINIERAENYFGANATFDIAQTFDESCSNSLDCPKVPGEYAIKSNCPYEMRCVEKKCSVGCYDLIDHLDLPVLKD
ncbi:hypothetical protein M0R01_00590 [bacterium]|nr:hypothetical protein [bacterium]